MKYRIATLLFSTITFFSCQGIKLILKEDQVTNTTEKWYFASKSNKYLKLEVNGDTTLVVFDTGGGDILYITNPKIVIEPKKIIQKEKKIGDAFNQTKKYISYSVDSVKSPLFSAKNMYTLFNYKSADTFTCDSLLSTYGIIGTNFYSYKKTLLLNYDKGYLQFLDTKEKYEGFYEVEAKFAGITNKISIKLTINGITAYFIFDTGNSTELQIDSTFNAKANLGTPVIIESLSYGVNSNYLATKQKVYTNKKIELNSNDTLLGNIATVAYNNKLNMNNLNLSFIQKYNWILDYTNKKLYFQPYTAKFITKKNSIKDLYQKVTIVNSKLIVSQVNTSQSSFKLNTEIESVQGNAITLQNICENRKLLNLNQNWDSLQVKIKK